MEAVALYVGAIGETVVFLHHFKDLPDSRQSGNAKYPLPEALPLCLLAVIAGAASRPTANSSVAGGDRRGDIWRRGHLDLCGAAMITITDYGRDEIAFGAL
jgi:hypothetical protein